MVTYELYVVDIYKKKYMVSKRLKAVRAREQN
jgi:hypothetical protein